MLKLGPRLRHGHPVLLDQIFGTRKAGEIEAALHALPLPVVRCFHLELSVGALFGLELAGGTRVALIVRRRSTRSGGGPTIGCMPGRSCWRTRTGA